MFIRPLSLPLSIIRRYSNAPSHRIRSPRLCKRKMDASVSTSFSRLSITVDEGDYNPERIQTKLKGKVKVKAKTRGKGNEKPSQSAKLRGRDHDSPDVRLSKTVTWLLRHGANSEGLEMRADGYVKVSEMLNHTKLKDSGLNLDKLQDLVRSNDKQRYDLIFQGPDGEILENVYGTANPDASEESTILQSQSLKKKGVWLIRARQGHSMKNVRLEMKPVLALNDIPTKTAVHGTNREAWKSICLEGLSKMDRNHIHIAQDVGGDNVISGMRLNSQILIYIDIDKAIDSGLKFWLSENGVILSEGNEKGYISRRFFSKVVDVKLGEIRGWGEI